MGRPAPAPGGRKNAPAHVFRRPGQPLYHTSYQLLDNILRSLTKYKFLLGTSAKVEEYQVLDETGQQRGSFYTQIDGVLTSQLTICYGEEQYDCYPRSIGKY